MYFDIALLNGNCTTCIYQRLSSNDLVPTASSRWNNELSVYEQTFSFLLLTIVSGYFSKQPQIPLFSGYNKELYTEFFLLIII